MTWSDIHAICSPNDWSMFTIHSTEEQEFVGFHVVSAFDRPHVKYRESGFKPSARKAYLGESPSV